MNLKIMKAFCEQKLKELAAALGGRLYLVGGTVRDGLAGLERADDDFDVCSPCGIDEAKRAAEATGWKVTAAYPATGSLKLTCGEAGCEFTSFRTDSYDGSGHAPERVTFTCDIAADAARRDFTCNAVYRNICTGQLVDPLGGAADIAARKLVPCKPPEKLFSEDGARILRLARFCGELDFTADGRTLNAAADCAAALGRIAPARIWEEMRGMLLSDEKYGLGGGWARSLGVLERTGALAYIFPSLAAGGHAERAAAWSARAGRGVRIAALLFPLGGRGAQRELARYPVKKREADKCARLIDACSSPFRPALAVRHADELNDIAALHEAVLGDDGGVGQVLGDMKERGAPLRAGGLSASYADLFEAGVPRRRAGEVMSFLLEQCAEGALLNEKSSLLAAAAKYCRTI